MKFYINIKPIKVIGHSKDSIVNKIRCSNTLTVSGTGNSTFIGFTDRDGTTITVYNIHKVRNKSQQIDKNGKKLKNSKIVRQAHWYGYKYTFSIEMLKSLGLSVQQGNRSFKVYKN